MIFEKVAISEMSRNMFKSSTGCMWWFSVKSHPNQADFDSLQLVLSEYVKGNRTTGIFADKIQWAVESTTCAPAFSSIEEAMSDAFLA